MCGLGCALLAAAVIIAAAPARKRRSCTATAIALVTGLQAKRYEGDEGRVYYHPVYEYQVNGVRYKGTVASLAGRIPQVHSQIYILYDPAHPERSCIPESDARASRIASGVLGAVGAAALLAGIGIGLFW